MQIWFQACHESHYLAERRMEGQPGGVLMKQVLANNQEELLRLLV